jgi:hypothetical protein
MTYALDDEVSLLCRRAVKLFRQYFLGKSHPVSADALAYYSEALTVLGEGFETIYQVAADKSQAAPGTACRLRFASSGDFCRELRRQAKEKSSRFDSDSW